MDSSPRALVAGLAFLSGRRVALRLSSLVQGEEGKGLNPPELHWTKDDKNPFAGIAKKLERAEENNLSVETRLLRASVQIKLLLEIMLCANPVVVKRVWREEFPLAPRTRGQ